MEQYAVSVVQSPWDHCRKGGKSNVTARDGGWLQGKSVSRERVGQQCVCDTKQKPVKSDQIPPLSKDPMASIICLREQDNILSECTSR